MRQPVLRRTALTAIAVCLLAARLDAAPPSTADRAQVRRATSAMTKAGNFYRAKKYPESGEAAREALEIVAKLPVDDSPAWENMLDGLRQQLARAKELLAGQGVDIPEWSTGGGQPGAEAVSFSKQVAPILLAQCGNCHVQRARGEFSLATFADLSKGSPGGAVLMPGDATGSRLVEVIESGDMPRGGGKVSADDLAVIKAWIAAGAKFDGDDPTASLASLAPGSMSDTAKLEVVAAADQDRVQFARDIGPILQENCLECHGERNAGANFSMNTFNRLLQGGANGAPLVPGKPGESLIIKKLRGTAEGARMPQGRAPLPEQTIAKFEQWIELGGKFDGSDATMPLPDVVAYNAAARMTHADLSKQRLELAEKTWRLILPDVDANRHESDNVLVVGGMGLEILSAVAQTADQQVDKLRKLFKLPVAEPFIRGRLTLYLFDKRYDYGEVGTMLEKRELPSAWHGHWAYNPLEPYGCILLDDRGEATPGLVGQQIAGVYLAGLGKVPRWFSEGSARAIAARLDPKDPRVEKWDEQVANVLATSTQPEGFLTGKLPPEESDVLSYSFVSKLLMSPTTRYVAMVTSLQQGTPFEEAFAEAYGGTPEQAVPAWLSRVSRRRR